MIRLIALAGTVGAALAVVAALTGCTGDRTGVLDPIMDPPDSPSITVTVPTVTSFVPSADLP